MVGIQSCFQVVGLVGILWIPAFAGMTGGQKSRAAARLNAAPYRRIVKSATSVSSARRSSTGRVFSVKSVSTSWEWA